jgi:hypothetical protein
VANDVEIEVEDFQVVGTLAMETFDKRLALVPLVKELDGLLEADGDENADDHDREMDEDVAPGVDGFVWCVDVDHVAPGGIREGY